MADEETTGAVAGAAQGASAGSVFGPVGALVGGVIGGAIGYFSGQEAKLAKKYGRLAQATRRRQQQMTAAVQRRDVIRQARFARAQAVAAGASEGNVTSSAVSGATSSITAQTESSLNFFDRQVGLDNVFQTYAAKAGKHAGKAAELNSLLGAAEGLTTVGANIYGSFRTPSPTTPTNAGASFNQTAAVSNFSAIAQRSSFGSSLYGSP